MACLVAKSMVFHGKWDGRWKTQKIGRRRHWYLPKHFVPWVLTPVMGEFGVIVKGGRHFFFSDQGPLLKGGGDVGGEYLCERVFGFFARMSRGRDVIMCNEAYEF